MNLPDTYAGGTPNLPLQVAKLVRLGSSTVEPGERRLIVEKLWSRGYFLDVAGIVWDRNRVSDYVQANDPEYARLLEAES